MRIELKPCPFCGGEAELNTPLKMNIFGSFVGASVSCRKCGARTRDYILEFKKTTVEQAFDAWNRRMTNDK